MDSACEAGRRAATAILDRTGTPGDRPFVDSYDSKGLLKWMWDLDDRRYRAGLPNIFDILSPFKGKKPSENLPEEGADSSQWPETV